MAGFWPNRTNGEILSLDCRNPRVYMTSVSLWVPTSTQVYLHVVNSVAIELVLSQIKQPSDWVRQCWHDHEKVCVEQHIQDYTNTYTACSGSLIMVQIYGTVQLYTNILYLNIMWFPGNPKSPIVKYRSFHYNPSTTGITLLPPSSRCLTMFTELGLSSLCS